MAVGIRLTISTPHCANDQGLATELRHSNGTRGMSPWETHLDGQDNSSLQLGSGALQYLLDCPNP